MNGELLLAFVALWPAPRGLRLPQDDPEGIRDFNVRLVEQSDGLLPKITDPSELSIATARCSHTTAVVRCLLLSPRSMRTEVAGDDGCVSSARLIERQPS